jgi:hypothetical protein
MDRKKSPGKKVAKAIKRSPVIQTSQLRALFGAGASNILFEFAALAEFRFRHLGKYVFVCC